MVLPSSAPDDALGPDKGDWLERLRLTLQLSRDGVLVLVDHARAAFLGELVRALLPEHPELEVHTDVRRVLEAPFGATLVLVPSATDVDWLNINRPLFAQRALKVVLFSETVTTVALAREAVDFFDWISHRMECPQCPPRFAVAGIQRALANRAPGIVWTGEALEEAFAAARPHGRLHTVSAALPYEQMVAEVREHRREWIVWTDISGPFRLRRVRWALAEAGRRTRTVLLEPVRVPRGWWSLHARVEHPARAREQLEKAGVRFPGRVAALVDLEPEALELLCKLAEHGLDVELDLAEQEDPGAALGRAAEAKRWVDPKRLVRGEGTPPLLRSCWWEGREDTFELLEAELDDIERRLDRDEAVEVEDVAWWSGWPGGDFSRERGLVISLKIPEHAAELLLSRRLDTSEAWNTLGAWALVAGDLDVAEHWSRRALELGSDDARLVVAKVYESRGQFAAAERLLREAVEKESPSELNAALVEGLGSILRAQGRYAVAEGFFRQGLAIREKEGKDELGYGLALQDLALLLYQSGRYTEAEQVVRQAIPLLEKTLGAEHPGGFQLAIVLAGVLDHQKRHVEAEDVLRRALAIQKRNSGLEHLATALLLQSLANTLDASGRHAEAEDAVRKAIAIREVVTGAENPFLGGTFSALSSILISQGKYAEAEEVLRKALSILGKALGEEHPLYGASLNLLGIVLSETGKYAEAEKALKQGLAIGEKALGRTNVDLTSRLINLGFTLAQQQRYDEAEPIFHRALGILMSHLEPQHSDIIQALNMLAQVQALRGNIEARHTASRVLEALGAEPRAASVLTEDVVARLRDIAAGVLDIEKDSASGTDSENDTSREQ